MNELTLVKMNQMKLYGMHGAFKTAIETGKTDHYSIDQFMAMLIEAEWDDRYNRKTQRMINNARFHYKASVEDIVYDAQRNINRNNMIRLAQCDFIKKHENLLITGSTGVGKSYIATAIGYQACIEGYRVMYYNTTKLFAKLKMAKADGSYLKEMAKLERQHLLIFDDFGLQPLDNHNRMILMELIEDRNGKGSVIVTSQVPVKGWYDLIGDKTIADAIMDRLVHQSNRIELTGESMRRKKKILTE
ncbi:IS21-like element helper ATPase IstB [Sinomicrobium oceani]|uniref:IS21-like element helper ATPase IstB n=1 Tax=Sinomicrobium oceani TaxID=1150368 RepID=UPI002279F9FD|nr:IS21-like element helper ATPase IstB [Sinomicrobium oceani]